MQKQTISGTGRFEINIIADNTEESEKRCDTCEYWDCDDDQRENTTHSPCFYLVESLIIFKMCGTGPSEECNTITPAFVETWENFYCKEWREAKCKDTQ